MIVPRYHVAPSRIAGAGKGLFLDEPLARGRVIIAPSNVHTLWPEQKLRTYAADSIEVESSVRWFEDWFSLSPEWCDECYVNHSFSPNGILHLGFVFAARDLAAGEEILIDYRYQIGTGEVMPFNDGETGAPIVGLPWQQSVTESARKLLALFAP